MRIGKLAGDPDKLIAEIDKNGLKSCLYFPDMRAK